MQCIKWEFRSVFGTSFHPVHAINRKSTACRTQNNPDVIIRGARSARQGGSTTNPRPLEGPVGSFHLVAVVGWPCLFAAMSESALAKPGPCCNPIPCKEKLHRRTPARTGTAGSRMFTRPERSSRAGDRDRDTLRGAHGGGLEKSYREKEPLRRCGRRVQPAGSSKQLTVLHFFSSINAACISPPAAPRCLR